MSITQGQWSECSVQMMEYLMDFLMEYALFIKFVIYHSIWDDSDQIAHIWHFNLLLSKGR